MRPNTASSMRSRVGRGLLFARPILLALAAAVVILTPIPTLAQPWRAVYPDDSVLAADVLVRARELADAGNESEAIRVLQQLLDTEGDRMLAARPGSSLYLPVRAHVHRLLLGDRRLLERYRAIEGPRAERLLSEGRIAQVESAHLLTAAGFEAALRRAQLQLEAARFESARLILEQLELHPDRPQRGADAARAMLELSAYLPRPEVIEQAQRWYRDANAAAPQVPGAVDRPTILDRPTLTPLDVQPPIAPEAISPRPLQSVPFDSVPAETAQRAGQRAERAGVRTPSAAWIFPTIAGDKLLVNDGANVFALDSATLAPIWSSSLARAAAQGRDAAAELRAMVPAGVNSIEDVATLTAYGNTAVAITGMASQSGTFGDRRAHGIELSTGRALWSVDVGALDERLRDGVIRGPAVIEGDVAVLSVRKPGAFRRVSSLYLVGIDLYTGEHRWTRLIGSVGALPWGRTASRPEGAVVDRGIVYRGDEIGLMSAVDAATGRPLWVRILPAVASYETQFKRGDTGTPPWAVLTPVFAGRTIFYLDPINKLVRIDVDTGELLGERDGADLGDPRTLLAVGDRLVGITANRITSVPFEGFDRAAVASTPVEVSLPIAARPVVSGGRLLVPTVTSLVEFDPATLEEVSRIRTPQSGNVLISPAGGESEPGHLITTDVRAVHTYLSWDRAEIVLRRRIAQNPDEAEPLLTYAELAYRNDHPEMVPELADRALTVIAAQSLSESTLGERHRLFTLLLAMAQQSREGWSTPEATGVIRDLALLDSVIERLARAAEGAAEQTYHLFELAWLREMQLQFPAAVEAYQRILLDESLAEVDITDRAPGAGMSGLAGIQQARTVATARLLSVLARTGPAPYRPFEEEAARLLELTPAVYDELTAIARRYPAASAAAEAWRSASDVAPTPEAARVALGESVRAARAGVRIGRESMLPRLGVLAGELIERESGGITAERQYRLVRTLDAEFPGIAFGAAAAPAAAVRAELAAQLATLPARPTVGTDIKPRAAVIESWRPLAPLTSAGRSRDSVVMISEHQKLVGLFATSALNGELEHIWSRPYDAEPAVVALSADQAVLFVPTPEGGRAEAISSIDGSTLWVTAAFSEIFPPDVVGEVDDQGRRNDRFTTPLDGTVNRLDLVISARDDRAIMVQRSGGALAINLSSGQIAWAERLPIDRVYEVELAANTVYIGGVRTAREGGRLQQTPIVAAFDAGTGVLTGRMSPEVIGDHPRWIRGLPDGTAIVATAEGISRFDPAGQRVLWTSAGYPARGSISGWVGAPGLILMDSELRLWLFDLATGRKRDTALEVREKLTLPATGFAIGDTIAIGSTLGVLVYGKDGELIGADAINKPGRILPPVAGHDSLVTIESIQDSFTGYGNEDGLMQLNLFIMSTPSAKIVATRPVLAPEVVRDIAILNGKILVTAGPATLVIDAPVSAPR